MTPGLTPRQNELLTFLKRSDESPTFSEMAQHMGLASKGCIARLIDGLEDRGLIERIPNRQRAIRVLPEPAPWSPVAAGLSRYSSDALIRELRRRGLSPR